MKSFVDNNPVVVIGGGLVAFVNSVLATLILFQAVHWTDAQIAGVLGLANSFVAFAATIYTQMRRTTPYVPELDNTPATVVEMRDKLVAAGIEPGGQAAAPKARRRTTRRRGDGGHVGFSALAFVVVGLVTLLITGSLGWALLVGLVAGALAAPW